jgi:tagaturonate reductase
MYLKNIQELKWKEERPSETKVLQFGEGNFLRAFVDWIIHRMNTSFNFGAGISVIQPIENGLIPLLNEQNGRYTLFLNGIREGQAISEHETVDCILKGINPYADFQAYMYEAENPELQFIISNTTEAGIFFDPADKPNMSPPHSFPAKLAVFLHHRYLHFKGARNKGLIFLPCELIDRNGDNLKQILLRYAKQWKWNSDFKQWIEEANIFCNTLVDRIVTGYPRERIDSIWKELGYRDQLVVEGEQFHLWVIECEPEVAEAFPADKAGLNVLFTDDMTPYRTRKVRILNGAHTSMVPVAYLYGLQTVRESIEHDVVGPYVEKLVYEEIIPTLQLPEPELRQFARDVMDRFRNPYIRHLLISISLNSISKFKTRVLPSILTFYQKEKELPVRLVFAMAALIRFYQGKFDGKEIPLNDEDQVLVFMKNSWNHFDGTSDSYNKVVIPILKCQAFWGQDLSLIPGLSRQLVYYLTQIATIGMKRAIEML